VRRLITIVLLVLLPLQAIWAASAPYCQHEHGQAAKHLGHHAHEHHQDDAQASQHDGHGGKATAFFDHDHHCAASLTLLPSLIELPTALPSASLVATPLARYRSFDASGIDRPNWPISL
jgi:hypothetical protein